MIEKCKNYLTIIMLIVVNDEGWIYKFTRKGDIKRKFFLGKYDLEGITYDKENLLIKYDIKNNTTINKINLPKSAQEGICFDNDENIYIADENGQILRYKAKELGI